MSRHHHPSNYHTDAVNTEQRINADGSVTTVTKEEFHHAHGTTHGYPAAHSTTHSTTGYYTTGHHGAVHHATLAKHVEGDFPIGLLLLAGRTAHGGRVVDTRVVGVERGVERLISTTEHVLNTEQHVLNERVTHHHTRVPKKVVREEVVEKTIVVPEVIQIEEWIDEEVEVEDRVIEIAKLIQIEKVVEVPEIEIIEKIIEVPEHVIREKIREVPRVGKSSVLVSLY